MDFKVYLFEFLVSLVLFLRNIILLVILPYKILRKIVFEPDIFHLYFIFAIAFLYFLLQEAIRPVRFNAFFTFIFFLLNFYFSIFFLYFVMKKMGKEVNFEALKVSFSYTLVPSFLWFFSTLFLYKLLPPPRTTSFLGVSFSVIYLSFSISLFLWKMILLYLVIRFLSGMEFFRVLYVILLYFVVFAPYFLLLYYLKIFRVPLI